MDIKKNWDLALVGFSFLGAMLFPNISNMFHIIFYIGLVGMALVILTDKNKRMSRIIIVASVAAAYLLFWVLPQM